MIARNRIKSRETGIQGIKFDQVFQEYFADEGTDENDERIVIMNEIFRAIIDYPINDLDGRISDLEMQTRI